MFTKGGGLWIESIADRLHGVGLDWTIDIGRAPSRRRPRRAAGQPRPERAVRPPGNGGGRTRRVLDSYGGNTGHVFNLGHGISQLLVDPPDRVTALVEADGSIRS